MKIEKVIDDFMEAWGVGCLLFAFILACGITAKHELTCWGALLLTVMATILLVVLKQYFKPLNK